MESPPSSLPSTKATSSAGAGNRDPKASREQDVAPPLFPEIPLCGISQCVLAGAFSAPAPEWCCSQRNLLGGNEHFCKERSAINQNSDFYLARDGLLSSKNLKLLWVIRT